MFKYYNFDIKNKNYSLYDADECYDDDVKDEIVIIIILFVFKSKLQI